MNITISLPNQLTILRIALTPVLIYTLSLDSLLGRYLTFFIFLIASLTDWYDGYVARRFGVITQWGKFLDPLADKILVLSTFFALAFKGVIAMWMVAAIAGRDVAVTGLRSYALYKRQTVVTSTAAKWKTAFQMTALFVLLIFLIVEKYDPAWLPRESSLVIIDRVIFGVTLFTVATGLQYFVENWRHLKSLALAFYRVFIPSNLAK
jgi:CDP-diacylglycerol--glycerol-3-phosphate 3-phosphatidyltransferase